MSVFAYFDATGCCTRVVDGPLADQQQTENDVYKAELPVIRDASLIFFDIPRMIVRGREPFRARVTPNLVSGLPVGTIALVGLEGTPVQVDDGTLELDVDYAETVHVVLTHVQHLPKEVEVPCEA